MILFKKDQQVVIKGRRRIGKSRLTQEFAKNIPHYIFTGVPPTDSISAREPREEFARQLHRKMKIPLPPVDDWGDLFWLLAEQLQKGKAVLVLDEISWMGSKDHLFLGKLKIAWDLYFKSNLAIEKFFMEFLVSILLKSLMTIHFFSAKPKINQAAKSIT